MNENDNREEALQASRRKERARFGWSLWEWEGPVGVARMLCSLRKAQPGAWWASRKDVGYCCFKQEITVSTLLVHLLYAWLCARASMGAVMKSLQQAQGRRTYHPHFTDKEHVTQAQG